METLFILIGLFLVDGNVDVKIIKNYGSPSRCVQDAIDLNAKALAEKKLYKFFCRPTSFTET